MSRHAGYQLIGSTRCAAGGIFIHGSETLKCCLLSYDSLMATLPKKVDAEASAYPVCQVFPATRWAVFLDTVVTEIDAMVHGRPDPTAPDALDPPGRKRFLRLVYTQSLPLESLRNAKSRGITAA